MEPGRSGSGGLELRRPVRTQATLSGSPEGFKLEGAAGVLPTFVRLSEQPVALQVSSPLGGGHLDNRSVLSGLVVLPVSGVADEDMTGRCRAWVVTARATALSPSGDVLGPGSGWLLRVIGRPGERGPRQRPTSATW